MMIWSSLWSVAAAAEVVKTELTTHGLIFGSAASLMATAESNAVDNEKNKHT